MPTIVNVKKYKTKKMSKTAGIQTKTTTDLLVNIYIFFIAFLHLVYKLLLWSRLSENCSVEIP